MASCPSSRTSTGNTAYPPGHCSSSSWKIHQWGSCQNFYFHNSNRVNSFRSTTRPHRNFDQVVDQSTLAPARMATATIKHENSIVSFCLLNIQSLTSKGHLIQDLHNDRNDFANPFLTTLLPNIMLLGDFNICMDNSIYPFTKKKKIALRVLDFGSSLTFPHSQKVIL